MTASGRVFSIANENAGQASDAYSMNGSMGATYNWNPNTRLTGALNVTQARAGVSSTLFTSHLVTAVYTPSAVKLESALYTGR